jgi:hypothetical protein
MNLLPLQVTAQGNAGLVKGAAQSQAAQTRLPDELSPEIIDGLLARMTDADIRGLLRDELVRRAEEQARAETVSDQTLAKIRTGLAQKAGRIQTNVTRWADAIANLDKRLPNVEKRLEKGPSGISGMIMAWAAVMVGGIGAALLVIWITGHWRRWLRTAESDNYWEKVARSVALFAVEIAPIIAFVSATQAVSAFASTSLGPMTAYTWIHQVGVS